MATPMALHQALDLWRRPMLAGVMRDQPLPRDVLLVIKTAASDEAALLLAAEMTAETPRRIREAALLWLQNVLMTSKVDHYRVLGLEPGASQEQIREHLGWLMKWLHPDRTRSEWDSAFARRVLAAWDALKTPDRRAAYDLTLQRPVQNPKAIARVRRPAISRPTPRIPWIARPVERPVGRRERLLRAAATLLTAPLTALALKASAWRMRRRLARRPETPGAGKSAQSTEAGKERSAGSAQPAAR